MAGLQLSGLASGFDWKSVVDQLMQIERVPQDRLRTEKTRNTSKLTAFTSLRTRLTALQDAAKALSNDAVFSQRSAALSNDALGWSATAASGTATGEYVIDVSKLATRTVRAGSERVSRSLNATNDVSGLVLAEARLAMPVTAGVFTVNGVRMEVEPTDTLQDLFDQIAAATNGGVTGAYDPGADRVTLSGPGPVTLGSGADTSNVLFALKLFNNDSATVTSKLKLATLSLSDSIAASGLGSAVTAVDEAGRGSFSINGVAIAYSLEADSLRDVIARVNASSAGVVMEYDAGSDRFALSNSITGDLGLSVAEDAGGLLGALGLASSATVTRGSNAEFTIGDGATIVTASNVLDESVHRVTGLSVTPTSLGQQRVVVSANSSAIGAAIRSFITRFNEVQTFIDEQTKVTTASDGTVTTALLTGNQELSAIGRELRSRAFGEVAGLSGAIKRLEGMGVDFEGSSSLLSVRNESAFSAALASRLSEVTTLFSNESSGVGGRIDNYVTALGETSGVVSIQQNSLERQNRSLDTQIAEIERRLVAERTRLEAGFIRMEQAQSLISSQLAALQSTLNLE